MKSSFVQLHIAILLAGFTGVLGRLITLNEGMLVWYRMLFSTAGLLLVALISGSMPKPAGKGLLRLTGVGAVIALHWVFFYGSIKYANVSVSLVCFSAVGFFTALLDPVISRTRMNAVDIGLGLMVMSGIMLIFHFDTAYRTGILLGVASALLAAIFTILNKSLLRVHDAATVTFYEMAGGCLTLTLLLPLYLKIFPPDHVLPTLSDLGWLLFLSLLCTVLAFRLSLNALREISPFTVNLSYNLEPVYGILLAFLLYREDKYLGPGFFPGLAIIMVTVAIQSWRVWKKRQARDASLT